MAAKQLKNIFLSASIPLPERDAIYYETADVIAIRDAVIALTSIVLPKHRLIWGGHPSITPLVYYVMQKMKINIQEHLTLYQSKFFEQYYPEDNNKFENIVLTPIHGDRDQSLGLMRELMFYNHEFSAGIFIGGMDGVETEYEMFRQFHPEAIVLPMANTGAAAKIIHQNQQNRIDRLESDYAYMSVFEELLMKKLN